MASAGGHRSAVTNWCHAKGVSISIGLDGEGEEGEAIEAVLSEVAPLLRAGGRTGGALGVSRRVTGEGCGCAWVGDNRADGFSDQLFGCNTKAGSGARAGVEDDIDVITGLSNLGGMGVKQDVEWGVRRLQTLRGAEVTKACRKVVSLLDMCRYDM